MSDFFFWFWLIFGCCIIACSMAWLTKALNILAKQLGVGNDYYFLLISVAQHIQINTARIEALEAELAAAKTVNREVLSRENDDLRKINGEVRARIEALEEAGKRLADAVKFDLSDKETIDPYAIDKALAAWRAAEKEDRNE